jgi:uncharacterized protein YbaA (DUF1428 family)
MTYFEGFIVPVPEANKDAYLKHASAFAPLVQQVGVRRMVESWDSDVPEGKVTDFRKAVDAKPDEKIVFSWFEYPSRQERDAANEKFMSDPRMEEMGANMPFDGKRMIMGGFDAIVEEGSPGGSYTDGFIVPVIDGKARRLSSASASKMAKVFRQHGASRVIESIADDVNHGQVTDFYRAVKAEDGETVVFRSSNGPTIDPRQCLAADHGRRESEAAGRHALSGPRMFWGGSKDCRHGWAQATTPQARSDSRPEAAAAALGRPAPHDVLTTREVEPCLTPAYRPETTLTEERPQEQGDFIWYELMTPDPDGAKAFYDAVVGWNIEAQSNFPNGYRMIGRSDASSPAVLPLDEEMQQHGRGRRGSAMSASLTSTNRSRRSSRPAARRRCRPSTFRTSGGSR